MVDHLFKSNEQVVCFSCRNTHVGLLIYSNSPSIPPPPPPSFSNHSSLAFCVTCNPMSATKEDAEHVRATLEKWSWENPNEGCRPIDLAKMTGLTKKIVNNALYQHLKDGKVVRVQLIPPLWNVPLKPSKKTSEDPNNKNNRPLASFRSPAHKPEILVFIDLGNVHDCLVPATELAVVYAKTYGHNMSHIRVQAYADRAYNGSECQTHANYIWRASDASKHAADVKMVMDVANRILKTDTLHNQDSERKVLRYTPCIQHIILASRDSFVYALAENIRQEHANVVPEVSVVSCWAEMREFLE